MSIKKEFGQKLKEIRTKKRITQFQLAEKVGIDAKHMSHIETGRSFPKADLIERLAAALSVDYNEFFKTEHLKDKTSIIQEINNILATTSEDELRKIYRIIFNLLY